MSYQRVVGTLNPGAHPGSYNGQDAYNDLLITEAYGTIDDGSRTGKRGNREGGCSTLNCNHEQPILLSDRKGHNGMTTDGTATTLTSQEKERPILAIRRAEDAATRDKILRILQETYGAEEVGKWGIAVMDALQQAEVLRQDMHGSSVPRQAENGKELDDDTLPRPELVAEWVLRGLRKRKECGCTSQGREPAEQQPGQSTETLPELPLESAQAARQLLNMWSTGEGTWLLQQTLHTIQEIWGPAMGERGEGGDAMKSVVRRLTPLE